MTHARTGRVIAERVEVAESVFSRMRGLLGRKDLLPGNGMWLKPCGAIHTFFMQFALDVLFLDDDMIVRGTRRNLKPWRLASCAGARSVVELCAGALDGMELAEGDTLRCEECL